MAEAVTNQTPVTCVKDENVCMQDLCESLKLTSQTPLVISFFSLRLSLDRRHERNTHTHTIDLSLVIKKNSFNHACTFLKPCLRLVSGIILYSWQGTKDFLDSLSYRKSIRKCTCMHLYINKISASTLMKQCICLPACLRLTARR